MGYHPDRQQDLFRPPSRIEVFSDGVQARLRPLLQALLTEAVRASAATEVTREIGDDQDHA